MQHDNKKKKKINNKINTLRVLFIYLTGTM